MINPIHTLVSTGEGGLVANADLALVSRGYDCWYVLFVAPSRTADLEYLQNNVEAAVLSDFGHREAEVIKQHINDVDETRLSVVVAEGPRFVIVTDDPHHGWDDDFKSLEVDIMIVEPFHVGGDFVFRINGTNPFRAVSDVVGICETHPNLPGCLVVDWISPEGSPATRLIDLEYGDAITQWELTGEGPRSFLLPMGTNAPVFDDPRYEIVRSVGEIYSIRKAVAGG